MTTEATVEKVASPDDLFEVILNKAGTVHGALASLQRKLGEKRTTFRRSELVLADIDLAGLVRAKHLKPLQDGPETLGMDREEILNAWLPDKARPAEMLEAAMQLVDSPMNVPEQLRRAMDEKDLVEPARFIPELVERLAPVMNATTLLPVLRGLEFENQSQGRGTSNIRKLCARLLGTTPPEQWHGEASTMAMPKLLDMLEEGNAGDAVRLLAIVTAIQPQRSLRLFQVFQHWMRHEDSPAREAAEKACYSVFHAVAA